MVEHGSLCAKLPPKGTGSVQTPTLVLLLAGSPGTAPVPPWVQHQCVRLCWRPDPAREWVQSQLVAGLQNSWALGFGHVWPYQVPPAAQGHQPQY